MRSDQLPYLFNALLLAHSLACSLVLEPQAHAEATGHSNFAESAEALKARKCVECGKLCRSTVEEDQHTRFTSHNTFEDADVVMTDVINEKTKLGGSAPDEAAGSIIATTSTSTITKGDNDERLHTLTAMGFSANKALRALHYTNDGTVEQAVDWISANDGNDPECSDEPFVKPSKLTPEEAKAKAEELIKQAKMRREKEEKEMEKLREAERIRSGKEMAAIARKEEEQRLKRMVELREREKKEEKAAREKIRKKLEQDRMERRARAGLSADGGDDEAGDKEGKDKNKPHQRNLVVKPREKGDAMRGFLVSLKKSAAEAESKTAFETLNKLVGNVARDASNPKFRTIKLDNKAIQERVGRWNDAIEFLKVCGWRTGGEGMEGALVLVDEAVDEATLRMGLENLDSALNNPFFGTL